MSAANWRKAMNSGAGRMAMGAARPAAMPHVPAMPTAVGDREAGAPSWLRYVGHHLSARHVIVLALLLVYPFVATPFFSFQIAATSFKSFRSAEFTAPDEN